MLFNIITILVSAIACGGIAVAFRSRQELRLLKEAKVRHIQRKSELHKELALADAENEVLLKNYQLLDEHCSELDSDINSIASMYETLFYENQNLNFEIDELHQRVTRLSDLYKLVCEENKGLLEELNADMSVQVVNDPTDSYKE